MFSASTSVDLHLLRYVCWHLHRATSDFYREVIPSVFVTTNRHYPRRSLRNNCQGMMRPPFLHPRCRVAASDVQLYGELPAQGDGDRQAAVTPVFDQIYGRELGYPCQSRAHCHGAPPELLLRVHQRWRGWFRQKGGCEPVVPDPLLKVNRFRLAGFFRIGNRHEAHQMSLGRQPFGELTCTSMQFRGLMRFLDQKHNVLATRGTRYNWKGQKRRGLGIEGRWAQLWLAREPACQPDLPSAFYVSIELIQTRSVDASRCNVVPQGRPVRLHKASRDIENFRKRCMCSRMPERKIELTLQGRIVIDENSGGIANCSRQEFVVHRRTIELPQCESLIDKPAAQVSLFKIVLIFLVESSGCHDNMPPKHEVRAHEMRKVGAQWKGIVVRGTIEAMGGNTKSVAPRITELQRSPVRCKDHTPGARCIAEGNALHQIRQPHRFRQGVVINEGDIVAGRHRQACVARPCQICFVAIDELDSPRGRPRVSQLAGPVILRTAYDAQFEVPEPLMSKACHQVGEAFAAAIRADDYRDAR